MSTINIRFAHYPSRSPIMLELQIKSDASVAQLKVLVEEQLVGEHVLMRVFSKWYLEHQIKDRSCFIVISDSDLHEKLCTVGIEDECIIYLEGPFINSLEDIGVALAWANIQNHQAQEQLKEEFSQQVKFLSDEISTLRFQMHQLREQVQPLVFVYKQEMQRKKDEAAAAVAEELLANDAVPHFIFWNVITHAIHTFDSLAVALAIVNHPKCGLDKRLTDEHFSLREKVPSRLWGYLHVDATPLVLATIADRTDVMKTLIELGADPNAKYRVAHVIHDAIENGSMEALQLLLDHGADIETRSKDDFRPLHQAIFAQKNSKLLIDALIANGANLESVGDYYTSTPFFEAVRHGNSEGVAMLIDKGANINVIDRYGMTAFAMAISQGHIHIIKTLITKGVNVQVAVNQKGNTPLHECILRGIPREIKELLSTGADVNAVNLNGYTPLHTVAERGHVHNIRLLVEAGADVCAVTNEGRTPIDVFLRGGGRNLSLEGPNKNLAVQYLLPHNELILSAVNRPVMT